MAEDKSKEKLDRVVDKNKDNAENKDYEVEILNFSENDAPKGILTFKIIIIGNSGVGKTSITNNATKNVFIENYRSTIGMEIFSLYFKINHKLLKLQIWDTCGQEIYRSLITNFYRNSSLALIVYSIDKRESFKDIDLWIKELKSKSSPDIKIILVGNKTDLIDVRQVSYEEGAKYLEQPGITRFFETSAKTGENIQNIFKEVAIILYKDFIKYGDEKELLRSESFQTEKSDMKPQKKSCC